MKLTTHTLSPVPDLAPGVGYRLAAMEEVRSQLREDLI